MDEAAVIMCGLKTAGVIDAIDVSVAHYGRARRPFKLVGDYDVDNVSRKVLRIILSYTGFVNRTVWFKR
jgi:UDP-N-acetylglucosamine 2-epimerase (non-hydrolysing)